MDERMETVDLPRIRQKLEDEKAQLMTALASEQLENGRSSSRNPDRGELAQEYSSRERDRALQMIEKEQLKQIETALERLDEGTYGRCQSCGNPIPSDRLEILPHAALCVTCQSLHERMFGRAHGKAPVG